MTAQPTPPAAPSAFFARRRRNYRRFIIPALVVVGAVIIFPWMFTVWLSAFDWKIGSVAHYAAQVDIQIDAPRRCARIASLPLHHAAPERTIYDRHRSDSNYRRIESVQHDLLH